jgi:hypothetical protein
MLVLLGHGLAFHVFFLFLILSFFRHSGAALIFFMWPPLLILPLVDDSVQVMSHGGWILAAVAYRLRWCLVRHLPKRRIVLSVQVVVESNRVHELGLFWSLVWLRHYGSTENGMGNRRCVSWVRHLRRHLGHRLSTRSVLPLFHVEQLVFRPLLPNCL